MALRARTIPLWILSLLCAWVLVSCADSEAAGVEETASTASASSAASESCESHETEVEPGICSYTVDCDDAESCEAWAAGMIGSMEEWLGELTYSEEWDVDEQESEKDTDAIASYEVDGNTIGLVPANEDEEYFAWLWSRFAWIIPSDYRRMISSFELYDHADIMAYVVQDEDDADQWVYAANQNQPTYETERVMTDIHEFGHLLSLNADEIDPDAADGDCSTLMLDEGCAYEGAYIYDFYRQYWEEGESADANDYVTEYAMSSLYEDFAESWAYFVLTGRPAGDSVANGKVSFLYQ